MQELMDIVAEIRSRSVNAGIIMIEGELAARSLYSRHWQCQTSLQTGMVQWGSQVVKSSCMEPSLC